MPRATAGKDTFQDGAALIALAPPFILLEDRLTLAAPARLYRNPVAIIRCGDPARLDEAFDRIEDGLARGFHAAGLFSYELGYALEPSLAALMPADRQVPLLWFGLFEPPLALAAEDLDAAFADLGPPPPVTDFRAGHDRTEHAAKIGHILELIAAGDIYQANLTFPMRFRFGGEALALYGALRSRQAVAHGGAAAMEGMTILSVSPELWIDVSGDYATARPMKGTAARGATPQADQAARHALAADPKQRAENLMIVDLLRNDLARISDAGTVRVPALFTVETYPGFHTLTSTVTARLKPGIGLKERVTALFPCGSVVGAPKIRAGEIIRALEPEPRGFYTGALGALAPNGDMRFNVAIRTVMLTGDGEGRYGVGGGIVADSRAEAEYEEALLKARVLSELGKDYGLIETFGWSRAQGFVRLDRHLDRLARSAAQLGFAFDRAEALRELARLEPTWSSQDENLRRRLRLLLARNGELTIAAAAIPAAAERVLRIGMADHRVDPGDPFLRHKTTRREVYDAAFADAEARGLDEILFLNRRGFVAEASRNSVFAEIGGRLITPPLDCGVLPGILRETLIEDGIAVEGTLTPADLKRARVWFLGNSLHGLREAALA